MRCVTTFVSDIFSGIQQAYLYIWVSKSHKLAYVGQTNNRYGTWGRGYFHMQSNGTLRIRCEERLGVYLESIKDLTLFSYPLPNTSDFNSTESSFRLAVEYLVQVKLYEVRKDCNPTFTIISNICPTDRTNNKIVKELSAEIVQNFIDAYEQI